MWTIWHTSFMSLIVWPQKYVSGVELGQRECHMSPYVRLWRLMRKSMWVSHVTDTSNLTLPEEELRHRQLTGVRFNAGGCVVLGLVIVKGCQEQGRDYLNVLLFNFPIIHYWSLFRSLIQMWWALECHQGIFNTVRVMQISTAASLLQCYRGICHQNNYSLEFSSG